MSGDAIPKVPALAAAVLAALVAAPAATAQPGKAPVPVAASTVVGKTVSEGRSFVGSVIPRRESTVGSTVEERVAEFLVEEGDRVEEGQPLAKLRTLPLEIQRAGAEAELEALQQELAELEHGSRPEELDRGRAELAQAEATRDYALARRRRLERLVRERVESPELLDEAISNAEAAEQAVRAASAALDLLVAGPRAEQIAQARATVVAQQETIRRLRDQLDQHTIAAPFDGYVTAEHTEVGEWVGRGDPIVDLAELDHVYIDVKVLETDIRYVHAGTSARVEINALPDEPITGEVALVVPQADMRSRTFPVKVEVANDSSAGDPLLKSGMIARVTLPVGQPHEATLVLKDSLVLGGQSPLVYVIETSGEGEQAGTVVQPVPVELGVAEGELIEVRGPLKVGQRVVVQGNERLRPGQPVEVIREVDPEPKAVAAARP